METEPLRVGAQEPLLLPSSMTMDDQSDVPVPWRCSSLLSPRGAGTSFVNTLSGSLGLAGDD